MKNYTEEEIENFTKSVEEMKVVADKAMKTFSNVMTPELKEAMNPIQQQFIKDAENVFGHKDMSPSDKMERLQELLVKGENII